MAGRFQVKPRSVGNPPCTAWRANCSAQAAEAGSSSWPTARTVACRTRGRSVPITAFGPGSPGSVSVMRSASTAAVARVMGSGLGIAAAAQVVEDVVDDLPGSEPVGLDPQAGVVGRDECVVVAEDAVE